MLVGQREVAVAVIGDVPAGRLRAQPLPDVALGGVRGCGQFGGGEGPGAGHGPVEAELVADDDHGSAQHGADVTDGLVNELHQLGLVHVDERKAAPAEIPPYCYGTLLDTELGRSADQLGLRVDAELGVDVDQVALDRALAQEEPVGDRNGRLAA